MANNPNTHGSKNEWEEYFDVDAFLIPWQRVLQKWEDGVGLQPVGVGLENKLQAAAKMVYDAAFENPDETPSEETIRSAEWLLEMLAPGGGNDPEAFALIPDSFWPKLAGRAIVSIMKSGRKDVFLNLKDSAAYLGISETRLYHLVVTRRIPNFIDAQERNYKMRRWFRVDQLKDNYPILYKPGPGGEE